MHRRVKNAGFALPRVGNQKAEQSLDCRHEKVKIIQQEINHLPGSPAVHVQLGAAA
jgi:hypothetical protein